MRPGDGETTTDVDLLFDDDPEHEDERPRRPDRRPDRATRRRHRRNVRLALLLSAAIIVVIAGVGIPWALRHFRVADYSGSGSGSVTVRVKDGDSAADIGSTLLRAHVVKSVQAFTDAAENDPRSQNIQ